jgi:glycerol-3-phosphate dehydrogenase
VLPDLSEYPATRRERFKSLATRSDPLDLVVIGGGATGLGVALDAAARGFSTALFEADDFAKEG